MLIPVSELQKDWIFEPVSVLHVGASRGEEAEAYQKAGWVPVTWIEAIPKLASELELRLNPIDHKVINATIFDKDGLEKQFKIASNSQSSSLLNFGLHQLDYPQIQVIDVITVKTTSLETIFKETPIPNFINLDIQGTELEALKGLGDLIVGVDYVYTEVNYKEVYENCALVKHIDTYLAEFGFHRAITRWQIKKGWGDALYLRNTYKKSMTQKVRVSFKNVFFYQKQLLFILQTYLAKQKHALIAKNK
jgi:FkbM family methyltransferase